MRVHFRVSCSGPTGILSPKADYHPDRSIKVITIVGLIILGIVLDLGGGPDHDRIGFRYWKNPGPFVEYNGITGDKGRFLGWVAVLTQSAFSFIGTEIVAVRFYLYSSSCMWHSL